MRIEYGRHWIEFTEHPYSPVVNSSLHDESITPETLVYDATVDGIECAMLALYSAGIFKHANLTRVRIAFATMVDALGNV